LPLREGIELIHLGEFRARLDVLILFEETFPHKELRPRTGVIPNAVLHGLQVGSQRFIIFFLIMQRPAVS
jgi:hypothetical protein